MPYLRGIGLSAMADAPAGTLRRQAEYDRLDSEVAGAQQGFPFKGFYKGYYKGYSTMSPKTLF